MKRPFLLVCAASLAVAGVLLNCGGDDEGGVTPPIEAGPGTDSRTSKPDTSTPTPDGGSGDTGSDAGPTGRTVYGIDEANQLVMFKTGAPGTVTKIAVTGLAGEETIHGIDFRPKDGTLYALGSTGKVYLIAPATGVATGLMGDAGAVVTLPLVLNPTATSFGFDFNPPADASAFTRTRGRTTACIRGRQRRQCGRPRLRRWRRRSVDPQYRVHELGERAAGR